EKIIKNYNDMCHRAINMTPNEAVKHENWNRVKENIEKYKKEFKHYDRKTLIFKKNDKVLVKNDLRAKKSEDYFIQKGKILENEYGDIYKVELQGGKIIRRHESQLKKIEEGKLDQIEPMIDPCKGVGSKGG
ncbi:hypothetical protein H311_00216, partial [Anncaliia algerae PRA109]